MVEELTIGLPARAADVNVETIRYYQRRGLLEEPVNPLHGRSGEVPLRLPRAADLLAVVSRCPRQLSRPTICMDQASQCYL